MCKHLYLLVILSLYALLINLVEPSTGEAVRAVRVHFVQHHLPRRQAHAYFVQNRLQEPRAECEDPVFVHHLSVDPQARRSVHREEYPRLLEVHR